MSNRLLKNVNNDVGPIIERLDDNDDYDIKMVQWLISLNDIACGLIAYIHVLLERAYFPWFESLIKFHYLMKKSMKKYSG